MTSLTTMLALFPVAIGFAEGGETQAPLARVVIGGMFTASAISLVIIPVLYNMVEGWREERGTVLPAE
jgi:HAE1 family hydrophobic/amphiphilic exporter-1